MDEKIEAGQSKYEKYREAWGRMAGREGSSERVGQSARFAVV
jgi:hypothetical protein